MAELHVYDFDGTLFRSPHEPAVWDTDWWSDPASLLPPCVPENPGTEWWISSTVSQARKSINDPDVYAIMMTGRRDASGFRYRIPELLKQRNLTFDAVHLRRGGGHVESEKLKNIFKYLSRYPIIDTVRIWDDRISNLRAFKKALTNAGYTVYTEHVRAKSLDPLCEGVGIGRGEVPSNPMYIGIFLDASSKALLARKFPFIHDSAKNDHVTLGFGVELTPEIEAMIGKRVKMRVIGQAADGRAHALVVDLPKDVPFYGDRTPHITMSVARGARAKESNTLLKRDGYDPVSGPTVSGVVDTYPRSMTRTASAKRVASLRRIMIP